MTGIPTLPWYLARTHSPSLISSAVVRHAVLWCLAVFTITQILGERRAVAQTPVALAPVSLGATSLPTVTATVQAFLQNVTFTGGTSWVDDGSHACSIISVQE